MPRTDGRALTEGERALAASMFGAAIDLDRVRLHRRKWFPFQPKRAIMAPDGHIWVHPQGRLWRDDYAEAPLNLQGLFLHEMTHVWQAQQRGRWYLRLMRHPCPAGTWSPAMPPPPMRCPARKLPPPRRERSDCCCSDGAWRAC